MSSDKVVTWNPWHGCTKYSEGCRYCYVYRLDEAYGSTAASSECRRTGNFDLPMKRTREGGFRIESGTTVMTCFTSDFLLKDADDWREDCWRMIKSRPDCSFVFFTKRIERFADCVPYDWGDGYDNVTVGCTCENRDRAAFRLPIFAQLPIKHRMIVLGPMLESMDIEQYLDGSIEQVLCSGESGENVRPLNYDWVLDVRRQCVERDTPFMFHQTGAYFIKDGRMYRIPRSRQAEQARRAGIDYRPEAGLLQGK